MRVYDEILNELKKRAEVKFKEFSEKIIKSERPLIGVRIPELEKIAKSLSEEEKKEYLSQCKFDYFEDGILYGFIVAGLKEEDFFAYLNNYLDKCVSWADIDLFVPRIKILKNKTTRDRLFDKFCENARKSEGFYLRFYIVLFMRWYLEEEKTEKIFSFCEQSTGKGYYNDMAIAWLFATAYVDFSDRITEILKNGKIGGEVVKMTVGKICDSLRVGKEDKNKLRNLIFSDKRLT